MKIENVEFSFRRVDGISGIPAYEVCGKMDKKQKEALLSFADDSFEVERLSEARKVVGSLSEIVCAIEEENGEWIMENLPCTKKLFFIQKIVENNWQEDIANFVNMSLPLSEKRLIAEDFDMKEDDDLSTWNILNIINWKKLETSYNPFDDIDGYNVDFYKRNLIRAIVQQLLNDYMANSTEVPFNDCAFEKWKHMEEKGEL